MSDRIKRRLGVYGALVGVVLVSIVVAPSPAHAYVNSTLSYQWVKVETDSCVAIAQNFNSHTETRGNFCYVPDEIDGTLFEKDPGGQAMKLIIRDAATGQMLGKAEWHPSGEHLWVYDTKNDGDTFYFALYPCCDQAGLAVAPPGTNAVVDKKDWDLDYDEGVLMSLWAYDDSNLTDALFALGCGPPQSNCFGGIA